LRWHRTIGVTAVLLAAAAALVLLGDASFAEARQSRSARLDNFVPLRSAATTGFLAADLGTVGGTSSEAVAINEAGQIVGDSTTAAGETHAFSWTAAGGMVDLGTPGGASSHAVAVNEDGQVVGYGTTAVGETHAFSVDAGGRAG